MSYFSRNAKWLSPLIGICILTLTPMLMSSFNDVNAVSSPIPTWMQTLAKSGIALGLLAAAIGAWFTDTLSAHVVRVLCPGIVLGIVLAIAGITGTQLIVGMAVAWMVVGGLSWRYR